MAAPLGAQTGGPRCAQHPWEAPEGDIGLFWDVMSGNTHLETGNAAGAGAAGVITSCITLISKKPQNTPQQAQNAPNKANQKQCVQ